MKINFFFSFLEKKIRQIMGEMYSKKATLIIKKF